MGDLWSTGVKRDSKSLTVIIKLFIIVADYIFKWSTQAERKDTTLLVLLNLKSTEFKSLWFKFYLKAQKLIIVISVTSITFSRRGLQINKIEKDGIKTQECIISYSYVQVLEVNGVQLATVHHWLMPAEAEATRSFLLDAKLRPLICQE